MALVFPRIERTISLQYNASKIEEHLYLGSRTLCFFGDALKRLNIQSIFNFVNESPLWLGYDSSNALCSINVFYFPLSDRKGAATPSLDELHTMVDTIASAIRRGNVFLHCKAGVSRSPFVTLAFLIKVRHFSLFDAFVYLRNIRTCICPRVGFMELLCQFEQDVRGSVSFDLRKYSKDRHCFPEEYRLVPALEEEGMTI